MKEKSVTRAQPHFCRSVETIVSVRLSASASLLLIISELGDDLALDIGIDIIGVKVLKLFLSLLGLGALNDALVLNSLEVAAAKLADGDVVDVGVAAAPDALEGQEALEAGAVLVQVLLELVVDALLHGLGVAPLRLGVAVAKVVALAGGLEVEHGWAVGGAGAAVGVPPAALGVLGLAGLEEDGNGGLEDESVDSGDRADDSAALKSREGDGGIGLHGRGGGHGGGKGREKGDGGSKDVLHFEGVEKTEKRVESCMVLGKI